VCFKASALDGDAFSGKILAKHIELLFGDFRRRDFRETGPVAIAPIGGKVKLTNRLHRATDVLNR
jgi:hypothetical protein